jgi:hypothetical protein
LIPEVRETGDEATAAFSVMLKRGNDLKAYKTNERGFVK